MRVYIFITISYKLIEESCSALFVFHRWLLHWYHRDQARFNINFNVFIYAYIEINVKTGLAPVTDTKKKVYIIDICLTVKSTVKYQALISDSLLVMFYKFTLDLNNKILSLVIHVVMKVATLQWSQPS